MYLRPILNILNPLHNDNTFLSLFFAILSLLLLLKNQLHIDQPNNILNHFWRIYGYM